ncbi:MAG: substrate-binding domain-containing protein [Bacteroidota bacterium]
MCSRLLFLFLWFTTIFLFNTPAVVEAQDTKPNHYRITGSGTLYPLTKLIAHTHNIKSKNTHFNVFSTGTGGGFDQFIDGQSIINNASRSIKKSEQTTLDNVGIGYIEIPVALDGITVVVSRENQFLDSLSVDMLRKIFAENSPYTYWSDIDPKWPRVPIDRIGPGSMHGTYDYFNSQILDTASQHIEYRGFREYQHIADYLTENKYAIGYFGFAHYVKNQRSLKPLGIDYGKGSIYPNYQTINNESYRPLTRTLYLYVNKRALSDGKVSDFLMYYLKHAHRFCPQAGFIPLTQTRYQEIATQLRSTTNQISTAVLSSE